MQNFKYHILNILTIILFSYTSATAINQIIKHNISPMSVEKPKRISRRLHTEQQASWQDYQGGIIEKSFFKIPSAEESSESEAVETSSLTELTLLGTITGPWKIARAMIKKSGEKEAGIFALLKVNTDISNDVYGHKLTRIYDTKIILESNGQKYELSLYEKKKVGGSESSSSTASGSGETIKKTISRSELQQVASGKIDNATRGLRAGPYRLNGQIAGYRLIRVRPYNILYKLGARSGDIIKRVNGKALDSTEKFNAVMGFIENRIKDKRRS